MSIFYLCNIRWLLIYDIIFELFDFKESVGQFKFAYTKYDEFIWRTITKAFNVKN